MKQLDGFEPKKVGKRFVVGVVREAKVLKLSVEDYYTKWKEAVKKSPLSPCLLYTSSELGKAASRR